MKRSHVLKLREMLHKASASLSDEDALEAIELFPVYKPGQTYSRGDRFRCGGKLYRVLQDHVSQGDWLPDSTPALYAQVEKPGQGDTPDDPIPYDGNMELFYGNYYAQDGVTYRCFRSTGIPVYHRLADLVGIYVELGRG